MSKIRHHHLDSLVGFCKEISQMIIVYDYVERKKGPLEKYLCWICDHFSISYNKFRCIWNCSTLTVQAYSQSKATTSSFCERMKTISKINGWWKNQWADFKIKNGHQIIITDIWYSSLPKLLPDYKGKVAVENS